MIVFFSIFECTKTSTTVLIESTTYRCVLDGDVTFRLLTQLLTILNHRKTILSAICVAILILAFARYMPLSGDITQHFMLVDELTRFGGVREYAPNLGLMAMYPTGSHWIASIVGRIAGSPLLGITTVSVAALFACYLLMLKLAGDDSKTAVILFIAIFLLLAPTGSLVGWEVWVNFFYPQLVADVLFFGMLLWLAGNHAPVRIVIVAAVAGYAAMWVQPLIAIHLLGVSVAVLAAQGVIHVYRNREFPAAGILSVAVLAIISVAMFLFHPSVIAMRTISQNDGYLEFCYLHPTIVAAVCALVGVVMLIVHVRRETPHVDLVLGSSVIASAVLVALQSVAFHFMHLGSLYAIKKHMFIVLTLGMLNIVRLGVQVIGNREFGYSWIVTPVLAALMSASVLRCFTMPVAPIDEAIRASNAAAREYAPGTVVADTYLPPMINFMISQSSFQHPWNMTALSWMKGDDPAVGAQLVMAPVDRISQECQQPSAQRYVVVKPECLKQQ